MVRGLVVAIIAMCLVLPGLAATDVVAERPPGERPIEHSQAAPSQAGRFKEGQVVVKFKQVVSASAVENAVRGVGASEISRISEIGTRLLRVPAGAEKRIVETLRANRNVEYAEPNYICRALATPDDAAVRLGYQWNLERINAYSAWDITTGTSNRIAIVDTGISRGHPDLAGKVVWGTRCISGDSSTDWADDHGHGTHVAGIASALTNNGEGVAGVSWGAELLAIKVLDSVGDGSYSDAAQGIIVAANQGARVINCSFGGDDRSETLDEAVRYAQDRGALVVAAAGNRGNDTPFYPAACPGVVAVAATDRSDRVTSYSNCGSHLWIAAPGGDSAAAGFCQDNPTQCPGIVSTGWSSTSGDAYYWMSGTSMAAPHVSGLASLIWSVNSLLSPTEVRDIIRHTATDLGEPGWDAYYGWGLIDARSAVLAVSSLDWDYRSYVPLVMKDYWGD